MEAKFLNQRLLEILPDLHSFAPLQPQQFSRCSSRILLIFHNVSSKIVSSSSSLQMSYRFVLKLELILSENSSTYQKSEGFSSDSLILHPKVI